MLATVVRASRSNLLCASFPLPSKGTSALAFSTAVVFKRIFMFTVADFTPNGISTI